MVNKRSRLSLLYIGLVIAGHNLFIFFVYMNTRADLQWHLRTSFERLVYQHSALYMLAILVSAWAVMDRFKNKGNPPQVDEISSIR